MYELSFHHLKQISPFIQLLKRESKHRLHISDKKKNKEQQELKWKGEEFKNTSSHPKSKNYWSHLNVTKSILLFYAQ